MDGLGIDLQELCDRAAREHGLAPREREVLRALLDGHTEASIAEDLSISPHTVHAHVRSLYIKLDVHSRTELFRSIVYPGTS